jgi:DNA-binding PadR family transcriptional regulator
MSLKHTLLGFLSYGPMTGYDLKKQMDRSTQAFWHAHLGQIYPALKKMAQDDLVEISVVPQEGKPDKKYYLITDAGRAELATWLRQPLDTLSKKKDPVLLQLFFSGALPKATILEQLERQLDIHRAQLAVYETETKAHIEESAAQIGSTRESVMWDLIRQFGVEYGKTYIRWLEHAIEVVRTEIGDRS